MEQSRVQYLQLRTLVPARTRRSGYFWVFGDHTSNEVVWVWSSSVTRPPAPARSSPLVWWVTTTHKQTDEVVHSTNSRESQKEINRRRMPTCFFCELVGCCSHQKKYFPFRAQQNLPPPAVKGAARKPQESNRHTPVVEGRGFLPNGSYRWTTGAF
jgi:hypothetical protein